jgi:nicotinate phosphoribosyltransferase
MDALRPSNPLVGPLLTDLYQITMTYAHWKNKRHDEHSVFELFFRKNPFMGAFTVFCGLDEVVKHMHAFQFMQEDIDYLKSTPALQHCDPAFFDYLLHLDCSKTQIQALPHGSLAFPRVPLVVVSGPLGVGQLLETTLLTLINYPSLLATNAARMVLRAQDHDKLRRFPNASKDKQLPQQCLQIPRCVEFGLRRAQGPDGGFSASKYAFVGGFVATSNVKAGKELGVPISGTHAHAFVQSYITLEEVEGLTVANKETGEQVNLLEKVLEYRDNKNGSNLGDDFQKTNDGELAAFIAYGSAFPDSFLCLVDTYDTVSSGLLNFCIVSLVLSDLGYTPKGIRLDSGDLAALSMACARKFAELAESQQRPFFHALDIVASNDINEQTLMELNEQGHAITIYGIGTNLVTCQAQPALGCVYKLVELNGRPRLKLSQEPAKVLIPGRKRAYRLFGKDGTPLSDLMIDAEKDEPPIPGKPVLCRNPFDEMDRVLVTPSKVSPLHGVYFDGDREVSESVGTLTENKGFVLEQLNAAAPTGLLAFKQPRQYPVTVSDSLYNFLHKMWLEQLPVAELS